MCHCLCTTEDTEHTEFNEGQAPCSEAALGAVDW
jgi:hypothetical protein